jgi:hypothetical protein
MSFIEPFTTDITFVLLYRLSVTIDFHLDNLFGVVLAVDLRLEGVFVFTCGHVVVQGVTRNKHEVHAV